MDNNTVLVFTRFGMGDAPEPLRLNLAVKFLSLLQESDVLPSKILFYTEGVKLACQDSPVISVLRAMEKQGVELVLCKTCLDFLELNGKVEVGIVGGMADIIEAMRMAHKVISL